MHTNEPPSLLIVEDDHDLAEMLSVAFRASGYAVTATAWGEQALCLAAENPPSLIVLDIVLPGIDGLEVSRRLRASHVTRHIPIIFLTERRGRRQRLEGLEAGVTDYITKPFDIVELELRVRNAVRRAASLRSANPVTGLPERERVFEQVEALTGQPPGERVLLVVTLRGLSTFREMYGFIAADDVLRLIGRTLQSAVVETGGEGSFCGHLDDDVFVLIGPASAHSTLERRITARLSGALELFYPLSDRGRHAHTTDRLALSIALAAPPLRSPASRAELVRLLRAAPELVVVE